MKTVSRAAWIDAAEVPVGLLPHVKTGYSASAAVLSDIHTAGTPLARTPDAANSYVHAYGEV